MDPEVQALLDEHITTPHRVPSLSTEFDADFRSRLYAIASEFETDGVEAAMVKIIGKRIDDVQQVQRLRNHWHQTVQDVCEANRELTAEEEIEEWRDWVYFEEARASWRFFIEEVMPKLASEVGSFVESVSDAMIDALRPLRDLLDQFGALPEQPLELDALKGRTITMELKNVNPDAVRLILGQSPDPEV